MFAADEEAATLSTAHAAGEEITRMFPKFPVSFIFLPLTIFHVKWHTLATAAGAAVDPEAHVVVPLLVLVLLVVVVVVVVDSALLISLSLSLLSRSFPHKNREAAAAAATAAAAAFLPPMASTHTGERKRASETGIHETRRQQAKGADSRERETRCSHSRVRLLLLCSAAAAPSQTCLPILFPCDRSLSLSSCCVSQQRQQQQRESVSVCLHCVRVHVSVHASVSVCVGCV